MTKNRFLSKRLACLLTTALIVSPIYLIQTKSAHADAVTIANGATAVLADIDSAADTVTVTGPAGGINTAAAAITAATLTNTNAATTLTLSGTGGLVISADVTAAATTTFTIAMGTTNLTLGGAVVATGTPAITMNGGTLTINGAAAKTIAGTINGAGTIAVADNVKTFSGIVGASTAITNITVAEGKTGIFSAAVTGTGAYTGTTTGAVQFKGATTTMGSYAIGAAGSMTANGGAAQTITGTIDGSLAADQGILVTNNTVGTVTYASAVGATRSLALVTTTTDAKFNSSLSTLAATVADTKTLEVLGNLTLGATDAIITDAGILKLSGTSAQTVAGADTASVIKGSADGAGIVNVTNTSGVTFNNALGTGAALRQISIDAGASATIKSHTNLVDRVTLGANSVITVNKDAFATTETLFTNERDRTETVLADIPATAKIHMPANFKSGTNMILLKEAGVDLLDATGLARIETVVQDTPLVNYVASAVGTNAVITANNKSDATTASELGVNTNKAKALLQAVDSIVTGSDATALTGVSSVFNAQTTSDTAFTNQVSPQTDTITGSTIAAKAVTSGVQNVISTRLASLRSGDAYSTGIVTGSHMGANSGFIQAFGSQVDQKNKGNEFGYDADTTGFAIGFDTKIPGGAVIGISYAHSEADVDGKGTGRAKNDIKTDSVSLYADYATKDGYVEGSITYGKSDNKGSRIINTADLNRTYNSNYDSEQYSFRLSGGIPQSLGGGAFITPFAAATISQIKADAYTETSTTAADALRLRVAQDTVDSQVGSVGVKFHQTIKDGKTTFTPEVKLAINQEFGDGNITTTNTYQGGGASFKNSTAIEKTSATAGLGVNISSDNLSFNIGYEADVKDKYLGHSAQAKLTAKF